MLQPSVTTCDECTDVDVLLQDIDCQLAKLGGKLYNNIRFMLNKSISADVIIRLIFYKQILQCKKVNNDYIDGYTVEMIAGRVKTLKYK